MFNFIVADDHPLFLRGTSDFIKSLGNNVLGEYANGIEAFNNILSQKPHFAVLDISMPGMDGLEIAEKITKEHSSTKIILLTMHNDFSYVSKARVCHVKGYLLKEFALEELNKCVGELAKGKEYFSKELFDKTFLDNDKKFNFWEKALSSSEIKILKMISIQKSTKEIATDFFISEKTVETHRSNIIKKLNLKSERNALQKWCQENLI